MRATLLALVCAMAATPSFAQISGPETVRVRVGGRMAQIVVKVNGDASSAKYVLLGDAVDAFREFSQENDTLRIRVMGLVDGGEGWLVVTATKDGKPLEIYSCKIIVGQRPDPVPPEPVPPKPVPPVPPTPVPPEPKPPEPAPVVDPFVKALQDAARMDGYPKAKLIELYDAMIATGVLVNREETTTISLQTSLTDNIKKKMGDLKTLAPTLRAVVQELVNPLNAIIQPGSKDGPLTEDQKVQAKAVFDKVARIALEASR